MEISEIERLNSDFKYWCEHWKNDGPLNDALYVYFLKRSLEIPHLQQHIAYIYNNDWGYGEMAFRYMWWLLFNQMPQDFNFLEIGIFKGSTLSLAQLCAKQLNKNGFIYGIGPLSTNGDQYGNYPDLNYRWYVEKIHADLNVPMSSLIKGLSTDPAIKQQILEVGEGKFDMVYIDGSHDYADVISDIELADKLLKAGGYMVLDDASSRLNIGVEAKFKGHDDVAKAIEDDLENRKNYIHLFACGHNRIFKKFM
jgi:hypothetical protein